VLPQNASPTLGLGRWLGTGRGAVSDLDAGYQSRMQMWIVPAVDMSKEHHGPAEVKIDSRSFQKMVEALTRKRGYHRTGGSFKPRGVQPKRAKVGTRPMHRLPRPVQLSVPLRPFGLLATPYFRAFSWRTAPFIATLSYICATFLKKPCHINGLRSTSSAPNITERRLGGLIDGL